MYDIITVGSATVDVFVKTESELIKIKTTHGEEDLIAYPIGRKVLIEKLDFMTGGGATNTAVCFSRLGLKTACLSTIGKDDNGKKILDELKKEKIDFVGTIESKGMTSYSIVLDSIEHDRTILTYKALSNNLKFEKLKNNIKKGKLKTTWFYFCTMMGESFKTLEKLAEYAKQNKIQSKKENKKESKKESKKEVKKENKLDKPQNEIKIAFNPTNYLAKEGPKKLKKILDATDALVLNKEEAKLLLGYKPEDMSITIERLMKELNKLGPNIIVITDGANGAYCYEDGDNPNKESNNPNKEGNNTNKESNNPNKESNNTHKGFMYHIQPRGVNLMETTGAGDAFTSSFIAGLIKGKPIEFCLFLAQTNTESVIQHYGAKNILLTWDKVLKEMKKYKHKVERKKI